ncbi:hypothetical protein GCM10011396_43050 [Undibacterium terreum]|uniref:Fibronectin type-III domain-containing protein n=2 Tax=Undibacterium terreum TaxID=1224302 RepID=A0A916UWJ6_9BURK|nr:hypothetical protein GCM10011396_43050 [Undibacterium terreum]
MQIALLLGTVMLSACGGSGGGNTSDAGIAAPTGLNGTPAAKQINLRWDTSPGMSYTVYLAADPSVTPANAAQLPQGRSIANAVSPLNITGLLNGTTYSLIVVASKDGASSQPSQAVNVTLAPSEIKLAFAPQVSKLLSAVAYGNGRYVSAVDQGFYTSTDGVNWALQNYIFTSGFQDVIFSGTQFLAVGENGAFATSPDGLAWTAQSTGTCYKLSKPLYGNGTYLVYGQRGTACGATIDKDVLFTSNDGQHWNQHDLLIDQTGYRVYPDFFAGGKFVTANSRQIFSSRNGVDWDSTTIANVLQIQNLTYANGKFFAVRANINALQGAASDYHILWSDDAVHWNEAPQQFSDTHGPILYAGNQYVALGPASILTSADGKTWTATASQPNITPDNVIYANGKFVGFSAVDRTLASSTDGTHWTLAGYDVSNTLGSTGLQNLGGRFIAVNRTVDNGSSIVSSTDTLNWTLATPLLPEGGTTFSANEHFFQVAPNKIAVSTDGLRWTASMVPGADNISAIVYADQHYTAIGNLATFSSPDGLAWTRHDNTLLQSPAGMVYAQGKYVAFTRVSIFTHGTKILTSTDGISWNKAFDDPTKDIYAIAFGNGRFVTVGSDAATSLSWIMNSTDGVNWVTNSQTTPKLNIAWDISFGNGVFVANSYGNIYTSPDGANWTARSIQLLPGSSLFNVSYGGGQFIASGLLDFATSADGITWKVQPSITNHLPKAAYANGIWLFSSQVIAN